MKIINPSVEVLRTGLEKDFMTPEQFIERVGRTCYKSEDKITADSAAKFVHGLMLRGHEAMLEHWTLIFKTRSDNVYEQILCDWESFNAQDFESTPVADDSFQPKIRFTADYGVDRFVISGNIRAWRDFIRGYMRNYHDAIPGFMFEAMDAAPWFFVDILEGHADTRPEGRPKWLTPITVADLQGDLEHLVHHDITLKFVCDRGVSHELVRHRAASFAQESTRYCNYSSGKYGAEITVVRPSWCPRNSDEYKAWERACMRTEDEYMTLISYGCVPQQARAVLNNSLKTEVIMTGSVGHWHHFFGLRCGPEAQPDMREVACMARDLLDQVLANER